MILCHRQVLQRVSLVLGAVALVGCLCILAALLGRGDSAGYSVVIAVVVLVSAIPIGMPVVTATVLAVGARDMARHKAIVNRYSFTPFHLLSVFWSHPFNLKRPLYCLVHDLLVLVPR